MTLVLILHHRRSRIPVSISRSSSVLSDISNNVAAAAAARRNSSTEDGKENVAAAAEVIGDKGKRAAAAEAVDAGRGKGRQS